MRSFLVRRRAAALLVPWAVTACHGYESYSPTAVPTDAPVRVELTDRAAVDLAASLGPRTRLVHGRVAERSDSVLTLRVSSITRRDGVEESWRGEPVRVPLAGVARFERERLSPTRTGLFAAGVAAVLALAIVAFGGNGEVVRGGPGGGPTPPPQ